MGHRHDAFLLNDDNRVLAPTMTVTRQNAALQECERGDVNSKCATDSDCFTNVCKLLDAHVAQNLGLPPSLGVCIDQATSKSKARDFRPS